MSANVRERWLRQYVVQKLRTDPVFPAAWDAFVQTPRPILDVGCGVGLLAFYLRERGYDQAVIGVDRDVRKIVRAREMAALGDYKSVEFRAEDMREKVSPFSGHIALFDVLHYLSSHDQHQLLSQLAKCVAPGGMLMIRDAPRDARPRFWLTFLAEIFSQTISWNVGTRLHFPSREELAAPFSIGEFSRENRPLWGRTPFNNHLFIFRRHPSAIVPVEG